MQIKSQRKKVLVEPKHAFPKFILRGLLLFAATLGCSLPGFAANETFLKTYPLSSGGSFVLENVNGSVRVEGWSRDEVEVRAVKSSLSDARELERVNI